MTADYHPPAYHPPAYHPSEETLLRHASGGLDAAFRAVVSTHLAGCPSCRAAVLAAEQVGGRLLEALPGTAMAPDARARCLARLDAPRPPPVPEAEDAIAGYEIGRWHRLGPGVAMATLLAPAGGRAGLHLLRVQPGARLAAHGHRGLELTAVLEGSIRDETGLYQPGDVTENDSEGDHTPMAVGTQACLCLIAVHGKLRFHHWLLRLLQPWFGL